MKKSIWYTSGRIAFLLSWPLIFLLLSISKRTRIVVVNGDDVLVVRGWLSGGWWGLPGGGLHRGEDPAMGASRELLEETGIEVNASELQKIYAGRTQSERKLRYFVYAFAVVLDEKPRLSRQRFEVTHLEWMNWEKLSKNPKTAPDVRDIVTAFFRP